MNLKNQLTSGQYSYFPDYSGQTPRSQDYFSDFPGLKKNERRLEKLLKELKEQKEKPKEIPRGHSSESIHQELKNASQQIKEAAGEVLEKAPMDKRSEGPEGPRKEE